MNSQQILISLDVSVRDKVRDLFDKRWNARCKDCLAPCCSFKMTGIAYGLKNTTKARDFFTHDFVLVKTEEEDIFKFLSLCPLNILGKCLIYEERPLVCREWMCLMAQSDHLGVK